MQEFEYVAPTNLEDAIRLMAEKGPRGDGRCPATHLFFSWLSLKLSFCSLIFPNNRVMRTRYQAKAKRMAEQSAYPAMIAVATGQGAGPLDRGRAPAFSIEHLLILAGDLRLRCP